MKKQQPPKNRTSVLIGVIMLAVLTIAGLAVVASVASQQAKITPAGQTAVVNLRGESVCLPKKDNDGPQTTECAYGLKVSDDIHYALTNAGFGDRISGSETVKTGDLITVTGTLTPPQASDVYDIVGTIEVRSIKVQQ